MSKPGYPKSSSSTRLTQSTYTRVSDHQTFVGDDPFLESATYEDKAGDNTPGWPNAPLRSNYYLRSRFHWTSSPSVIDAVVLSSGDTDTGNWGSTFDGAVNPWDGNQAEIDQANNDVLDGLNSKLISNIQNNRVNLGEIYHTRQQAANMVGDAAAKIGGAFSQLKRGNPKAAIQQLLGGSGWPPPRNSPFGRVQRFGGGIPQQWLALRYGWLPLVQDAYNSVEAVHRAWDRKGTLFTAKASFSRNVKTFREYFSGIGHGPHYRFDYDTTLRGSAKIVYGVADTGLSSLSSLGITNPASLLWEVLPYSFVVDWFLPVGNWLQSLDYNLGLYMRYGFRTIKTTSTVTRRITTPHVVTDDIVANWSGGSGHGDAMTLVRQPYESFPSAPPPVLQNPFSPIHMANGISLLTSAFGPRAL